MAHEVTYFGQKITVEGVYTGTTRVDALFDFNPKKKKEGQRAIGLINWCKPYLKDLSTRLEFMTDLTQRKSKIIWSTKERNPFEKIVSQIKEKTLLAYPDPSLDYTLENDVPESGGGTILFQNKRVLVFSTKWPSTEIKYTIVEKERLIILKSLVNFKKYFHF